MPSWKPVPPQATRRQWKSCCILKRKNAIEGQQEEWVFRMVNTKRPLEEKIALFWHGILCTGHAKCENPRQQNLELDMFRRDGMGRFSDLLLGLAIDPAMVFFLDNCMSHKGAINENWGRELLELFALGVGMDGRLNYSEDDVKEAARAFTGWTVVNAIPRYPYGRYLSKFVFDPKDHDDGVKTFLGETGNWNGEDIIRIIAKQPAAARFVSRHLYNFFVADEPQVPAWQHTAPQDPEAIVAAPVQRGLLQERALCQGQEPGRDGGRHHASGRRVHLPQSRSEWPVFECPLYGSRPAEPTHRRGLAHRQGVDR